ncbi:type VI secretion system baseplate subunit TssK [Photorhabdus heterorhabditis]|uniref:Type VI secretion system baseplate subunit TssK n=1 Tax=Photorhabdus heterorhabditis TaxID=880156 RepID=A0A5B0X768_9GAMM|nr:type VI secretion system baseplate subunit TssK [Photorhabdus heterorhabditis]KAA1195082.1 type VI secretion system baseplate subunit TssK [Photorhabdus heterorhabditis]MBS9440351.1 type VI secretion system baseplate subunit TssK [Photorhabdus heterorhabditis]
MPGKNRVIWREGLFIKPQHFQQQQKHNDYLAHSRLTSLTSYGYGFSSLIIDKDLLALGRIGIIEASGIMPDGTVFSVPYQDVTPQPLDVIDLHENNSKDIYLALPITNDTLNEISHPESNSAGAMRYREHVNDIRDLHTEGGDVSQVILAQLTPVLKQGSEDLSAFTVLPLCQIIEKLPTGTIILNEDFVPTCTSINVSNKLKNYMDEVDRALIERARSLSNRIGSPGQQGVADVAEFMMLQLVNRIQPWFTHYARQTILHPEHFFTQLIQTCGELRTFTHASRQVGDIPEYNHDSLTDTFHQVMRSIREAMGVVLTPRAIPIKLQTQSNGIRVANIHDRDVLTKADFILAIRAEVPQEQLLRQFVKQTKIASQERIREMVSVQLPGVGLIPLPAAPRQLPYHAGYTYFRFDQQGAAWQDILKGTSIAFHVSGDFPGLDLQFWAVRNGSD